MQITPHYDLNVGPPLHMGIVLNRENICCLLQQTTITSACNRARESTLSASPRCGVLESARSPDAQMSLRGVQVASC